jgi:hypothetical protein
VDERLRDTQRRAQAGDVDAEASALRQRARSGELGPEDLELLVYVGHAPACRALDRAPPPPRPDEVEDWVRGLARWGRRVEVVAAIAAARLVLSMFESTHPHDVRPRRALELAEAWAEGTGPEAREVLEASAEAGRTASTHTARRAAWACYHAGALAYRAMPSQSGQAVFEALLALRDPARVRDTIRDRIVAHVDGRERP